MNELQELIDSILERASLLDKIRVIDKELEQMQWRNKGLERQKKILEKSY